MSVSEEGNRESRLADRGVKPSQLAHVVLRTARYKVMCDFYLTFLNAQTAYANSMATFLRYDSEHHRLVIISIPQLGPVQPDAAGLEHYSFTYPSLGALLANYERLKSLGIKPDWCINHGFTMSIYYRDPDGNQIETQFDNMTSNEADDFMATPYFDKNPIGVDFDVELLLRRYRAGDPMSELVKFKSAPYAAGATPLRPSRMPPYDWEGKLL